MVHSGRLLPRLPCRAPGRQTHGALSSILGVSSMCICRTALLWTPQNPGLDSGAFPTVTFSFSRGRTDGGGSGRAGATLLAQCVRSATATPWWPPHDGTAARACSPDSLSSAPCRRTPPALPCLHFYRLVPFVLCFLFPAAARISTRRLRGKRCLSLPALPHRPETCPFSTGQSRAFSLPPPASRPSRVPTSHVLRKFFLFQFSWCP